MRFRPRPVDLRKGEHGKTSKASRSPAAPFRARLVIMAKVPVAGRAKTRLAADVGVGRAIGFARHGAAAVMRRLAADARWETRIALTPDSGVFRSVWLAYARVIPQGQGDLGARMQRVFDRLPPGPVVIVGTDIPSIRPAHVAHAFRLLGNADAVFGPAGDGGYWLVAMTRRPRRIATFANVRWSSAHALSDTQANLAGRKVLYANTLGDVDDAASLRREAAYAGRVVLPV
jgi:rSAM/selenodomain-associated transferase 1